MKYTPGPWKRCGGTTPHFMAICDSSYRYIVFGMADNRFDTEHDKPIDAPGIDEQFANAKLISAAPDLLTALEAAYATFYDKRCELGLQVAAAISKATGKPVDET
jgi:hypothetical protein